MEVDVYLRFQPGEWTEELQRTAGDQALNVHFGGEDTADRLHVWVTFPSPTLAADWLRLVAGPPGEPR